MYTKHLCWIKLQLKHYFLLKILNMLLFSMWGHYLAWNTLKRFVLDRWENFEESVLVHHVLRCLTNFKLDSSRHIYKHLLSYDFWYFYWTYWYRPREAWIDSHFNLPPRPLLYGGPSINSVSAKQSSMRNLPSKHCLALYNELLVQNAYFKSQAPWCIAYQSCRIRANRFRGQQAVRCKEIVFVEVG